MRNGVGHCRTTGLRTFGACGDRSTASVLRAGDGVFSATPEGLQQPALARLKHLF